MTTVVLVKQTFIFLNDRGHFDVFKEAHEIIRRLADELDPVAPFYDVFS